MFQTAKVTDYIALNCALKFTYLPEKAICIVSTTTDK